MEREENIFQTPSQEFVTHFSWADTPLLGLQNQQGSSCSDEAFARSFPWARKARQTSNPRHPGSSFLPSHLPTRIMTGFRPGSLETFQCANHEEEVQPLAEGVTMLPSWFPHTRLAPEVYQQFCTSSNSDVCGAPILCLIFQIFLSEMLGFLSLSVISSSGSTSSVHKAGPCSFSSRYYCQSSDNSFHT